MQKDNIVERTTKVWDKFQFLDGFFDHMKFNKDYDWNLHKSDKGTTRYLRTWRDGKSRKQKEYIMIVPVND